MRSYRQDLTFDEVAAVLAYDPLTGVLTFRHASKRSPAGRPAGRRDKKGYLRTRIGFGEYKNHRLASIKEAKAMYANWKQSFAAAK